MLQTIREKTQGWIASLILGLVCFTFALWGIHYYLNQSSVTDAVAKVNGVKITQQTFEIAYREAQRQQQYSLGANYSTDPIFQAQLKQDVLKNLIMMQVVNQGLRTQGFYINPEQAKQMIMQTPGFQDNNVFSPERFQQILYRLSLTPQQFINQFSNQVILAQLQNGIMNSSFALPNDIIAAIHLMKQTRDVGYIVVSPSAKLEIAPISPEQIQTYYQDHQQEFTTPEKISIAYVELSLNDLIKHQAISDSEVQAYYQKNREQFGSKTYGAVAEQLKQLLAKQKAESQFANLSDQLANVAYENPDSLSVVAKQLNLEIKTSDLFDKTGSKTGIASYPAVVKAAFSDDVFKQGYNSEVIQLDATTQIVIHAAQKKNATLRPLAEVKDQIINNLKTEATGQAVMNLAQKIADQFSQGKTGDEIAAQYGVSYHEKQNVNRHQPKVNSRVLLQVFSMPKPSSPTLPSVQVIPLPSGNLAVVAVYKVTPGDPASVTPEQQQAFKDAIAQRYGDVFFRLYLQSLSKDSKVKTYLNVTQAGSGDER